MRIVSGTRSRARAAVLLLAATSAFAGARDGACSPRPVVAAVQDDQARDPFRPRETAPDGPRPPGLAGVLMMEVLVRGIVRPAGEHGPEPQGLGWAILEVGSGEGFVAAPGDRLLDGVLGRVEEDGIVFWVEGDPGRPLSRPLAAPITSGRPGRQRAR